MTVISLEKKELVNGAKPRITEPYVLFACVLIEIDEQGHRWTDSQWAKDLALHLAYLDDLTLVSPTTRSKTADLVSLDEPPFDRLKLVASPCLVSRWHALREFPRIFLQYWRAIGRARIVHAGFGGWPIVQGWIAVPLAKLRGKFVLANVESSPWRASVPGLPWYKRLEGHLGEYLTRYCLRISDIRLFTSKSYLQELLPPESPRAYVTPATWLNEEWILADDEAELAWAAKSGPVRLLFAARLVFEKGVAVLLPAIEAASAAGADFEVAIVGAGPLLEECIAFAESDVGKRHVRILQPVAYGDDFFTLVRGFDAVLVPSLSDEQPRIIYDALSQGVPVIGSATGGISEVVESEMTGRLLPPKDVAALARALVWGARNRAELRAMGLRGLASVRHSTHQAMHQKRHEILLKDRYA